jgi:hypothetical protein
VKYKKLLWGIPLTVIGIIIGAALLLLVAVACVVYVPTLRAVATEKAIALANEKSDMDIDVGRI